MAKCPICNSRKGKRKCLAHDSFVCSLCCGENRTSENCSGCSYYKKASEIRNYRKIPFYSTQQMSDSMELQNVANTIESILCLFDAESETGFTDRSSQRLLELILDHYHFKDSSLSISDPSLKNQCERMFQMIENDLPETSHDTRVRVLGSVYRSLQRRTKGGREYLDFIQQYVGPRVGPGARAMPNFL